MMKNETKAQKFVTIESADYGFSKTGRKILSYSGYTLEKAYTHKNPLHPLAKPTRMVRFFIYAAECKNVGIPVTKAGFLAEEGRENRPGYLSSFFTAAARTLAFNITRGSKGEYQYMLKPAPAAKLAATLVK